MNNDHIQPFTSKAIASLDKGACGAELDRQLAMLAKDIVDRPMDVTGKATQPRKLKLELALTPVVEFDPQTEQNVLVSIAVEPHIDGITPKVTGGKTEARMVRGNLLYNKEIPSKFDQRPLFPETEQPELTESEADDA